MFREIKDLSEGVAGLVEVGVALCGRLSALVELSEDKGNLQARITELERSREQWEARTEAHFLKSDSRFKSARSSEERARTMRRHAEALSGGENGEGEAALRHISELLEGNAEGGAEAEVPTVPPHVAPDSKTLLRMAKFGVNFG